MHYKCLTILMALCCQLLLWQNSIIAQCQFDDSMVVDLNSSCELCSDEVACNSFSLEIIDSDVSCCTLDYPNAKCKLVEISTFSANSCISIQATANQNANWSLINYDNNSCNDITESYLESNLSLNLSSNNGKYKVLVCSDENITTQLEVCTVPCCQINEFSCNDELEYFCYDEIPNPETISDLINLGFQIDIDQIGEFPCNDIEINYIDDKTPFESCDAKNFIRTYNICFCGEQELTCSQKITIEETNAPPSLEVGGFANETPLYEFGCVTQVPNITFNYSITYVDDDCTSLSNQDVIITDDSPGILISDCTYIITRTYSLTDACDETTIVKETFSYIYDTEKPIFPNAPNNESYRCIDEVPAAQSLQWTDGCGTNGFTEAVEQLGTMDPCSGGELTRTWSHTDDCGNTGSYTQVIYINPIENFNWNTAPQDITVSCGDPIPIVDLNTDIQSSDQCETTLGNFSFNETGNLVNCGDEINREWIVTTECGSTATYRQTITLEDNQSPTILNIPESTTYSCYQNVPPNIPELSWVDNCFTTGTVSGTEYPSLSEIDCDGGTIIRSWTISDDCGNTTSNTQTIVIEPMSGIEWSTPEPQNMTISCGDSEPIFPDQLYQSNDVNSDCVISGGAMLVTQGNLAKCGDSKKYTWVAIDDCGNQLTREVVVNLADNQTPVFTNVPDDITIDCFTDLPEIIDLSFTDNCIGNSYTLGTDEFIGNNLCQGGEVLRTWKASDDCGNSTSYSQKITVLPMPAIEWSSYLPEDVTIGCGDLIPEPIGIAYDNYASFGCSHYKPISGVSDNAPLASCGDVRTFTWTVEADTEKCINALSHIQRVTMVDDNPPTILAVPEDITVECHKFVNDTPPTLEWIDNCGSSGVVNGVQDLVPSTMGCEGGEINRSWKIADECGNETSVSQKVTIAKMPELVWSSYLPEDMTIDCQGTPPQQIDINFSNMALSIQCNESGIATKLPPTGQLNGCGDVLTYHWSAISECGQTITHSQTITWEDNELPVFNNYPYDLEVTCHSEIPESEEVLWMDNCDGEGVTEFIQENNYTDCGGGQVLRTWSYTDKCGNQKSHKQVITIGAINPVEWAELLPEDLTISCGDDIFIPENLSFSNNALTPSCSINGLIEPRITGDMSCGNVAQIIYEFEDDCGNLLYHQQTVSFEDNESPEFFNPPQDITLTCYEALDSNVELEWVDNCDGTGMVQATESNNADSCEGGVIIRTWEYTDQCGNNTVNHIQNITIESIKLPFWISDLPEDKFLNCEANLSSPEELFYSNEVLSATCGYSGKASFIEDGTLDDCGDIITRRWIVEFDNPCLTNLEHEQRIELIDIERPQILAAPGDATYYCKEDIPEPISLTWIDNCHVGGTIDAVQIGEIQDCTSGDILRVWTAEDGCGNSVVHEQKISIESIPELSWISALPQDLTISCLTQIEQPISLSFSNGLINTICQESGTIEAIEYGEIINCGDELTRIWTYNSYCGQILEHTQLITYADNTIPTFENTPIDITINCKDDLPVAEQISWFDNCNESGLANFTEIGNFDECIKSSIQRRWEYADICGNVVSYVQTINLEAIPELSWIDVLPSDITISCKTELIDAKPLSVTNGLGENSCGILESVNPVESGSLVNCGDIITRSWFFEDLNTACQKSILHTQNITLLNNTLPEFVSLPESNILIDCITAIPEQQELSVLDHCLGIVSIPFVEEKLISTCEGGTVTRTWDYSDNCNNGPISFTQIYTLIAPSYTSCDDGNPCTINDLQLVSCEGEICQPCIGELTECDGDINYVSCDDDNPCTENDQKGIACDGTLCLPCLGTPVEECSGVLANVVKACDDGDPCTINDIIEYDGCNESIVCIPCAGTYNPTESPIVNFPNTICKNEDVLILATACENGVLNWYSDIDGEELLSIGASYELTDVNESISLWVQCVVNGCASQLVKVHIELITPIAPTITGTTIQCYENDPIVLTASEGYSSYDWGEGINSNYIFETQNVGTHILTVTDNFGCNSTAEFTVLPSPQLGFNINGSPSVCADGFTPLSGPAGYEYLWSPGGETTQVINISEEGTYGLTITDENGCTAADDISIEKLDQITPTILGDPYLCGFEETELSLSSEYVEMLWSPNGETGQTILADKVGVYSVVVVDENGCTGEASFELKEGNYPDVEIAGIKEFCIDDHTILSTSQNFVTYEWSNGSTEAIIEVQNEGEYQLTVTNEFGCSGSSSVFVVMHESPEVNIIGDLMLCPNSEDQAILEVSSVFEAYSWDDGLTNNATLTVTEPGTYELTVTDENGCIASTLAHVTFEDYFTFEIQGDAQICPQDISTLSTQGEYSAYTWSTGESMPSIDVASEGEYNLTVTNENGCTAESSFYVKIESELEPTIVGIDSLCNDATNPFTINVIEDYESYDWGYGPSELSSLEIYNEGTYTVTVTNSNGCSGVSSHTITNYSKIDFSIIGESTICNGESTILSLSDEFELYNWSTGVTTKSISVNDSGVFTVTVTNDKGCTAEEEFEVKQIETNIPNITGNSIQCRGGETAVKVEGEWQELIWSNGESTSELIPTSSGIYSVTVTDLAGCKASNFIEVEIVDIQNLVVIQENSFCQGGQTTLKLNQNFNQYLWSNGNETKTIVVDENGTYSVTVTDENSCNATAEISIIANELLTPIISGPNTICPNESIVIQTSIGYASYNWGNGEVDDNTFLVNSAGEYQVTVTDDYGCTGTSIYSVSPSEAIDFNIEILELLCSSNPAQVNAGYNPNYNYQWSNGINTSDNSFDEVGIYTVTVTNNFNCTSEQQVEILLHDDPQPEIIGGNVFCFQGQLELGLAQAYVSYSWSNGSNSKNIVVSEAGLYSVTVTDENGCQSSQAIEITELQDKTVTISGETIFCKDTETKLSVIGWESVLWSTGETNSVITVNEAGSYFITVSDENDCEFFGEVEVIEQDEIELEILGSPYLCEGKMTTLFAPPGYSSYLWSDDSSDTQLDVFQPGAYSLTVMNALGCAQSSTVIVENHETPIIDIYGDEYLCKNSSAILFGPSGYENYVWSPVGSDSSIEVFNAGTYSLTVTDAFGCTSDTKFTISYSEDIYPSISGETRFCSGDNVVLDAGDWSSYSWSNGSNEPAVTIYEAGLVSVTVTDENGCSGVNAINITEFAVAELNIQGSNSFCEGGSTVLDAGVYQSYNWAGPISGESRTLETGIPGTYTLMVTDENGCTASAQIIVSIDNALSPLIAGDPILCPGGVTVLDAGHYTQYKWEGPQLGDERYLEAAVSGIYTLTVTDETGCSGTSAILVIDGVSPEPIISGVTAICNAANAELFVGEYENYLWSTGNTGSSLQLNAPGEYSVTVSDIGGCTASTSIVVSNENLPEVNILGGPFYCPNGVATLDAGEFLNYQWSTGGNERFEEVGETGTVSVTVTDFNGCEAIGTTTLSPFIVDQVLIGGAFSYCAGSSAQLNTADNFVSWIWTTGDTTQTIEVSQPGIVGVTVTDVNGCTSKVAAMINEKDEIEVSILGKDKICLGESTQLDAGDFDSWQWNGPTGSFNTRTIEVSEAGVYTVIIEDKNGCLGSGEIEVSYNEIIDPIIDGQSELCNSGSTYISVNDDYLQYLWSTGELGPGILITEIGKYSVTVTDAIGCTISTSIDIVESEEIVIEIKGDTLYCPGNTTLLDAGEFDNYNWSIQGVDSRFLEVGSPGVYMVTVTDESGCTATDAITVLPFPQRQAHIVGSRTYCANAKTTLDGGDFWQSWSWSTGHSSQTIDVNEAGTYSITVTDENGCTASSALEVIEDNYLYLNLSFEDVFICYGDSTLIGAGDYFDKYEWSTGQIGMNEIYISEAGEYTVTVTDVDGCTGTGAIILETTQEEDFNIIGETKICTAQNVELSVDRDFESYQWSTGETTQSIIVNDFGTYDVTVTNSIGCRTVRTIAIESSNTIDVIIDLNGALCNDSEVILSTLEDWSQYSWSNGAISSEIKIQEEGIYGLTVTDENGCTSASDVLIEEGYALAPIIGDTITICEGDDWTFDASGDYDSWLWSTGSTSENIIVSEEGTYIVSVTDINGCVAISTAFLEVSKIDEPILSAKQFNCIGTVDSVYLSESYSSYLWSNNSILPYIEVSDPGYYSVIVENEFGCKDTADIEINFVVEASLELIDVSCNQYDFNYGVSFESDATFIYTLPEYDIDTIAEGSYLITDIDTMDLLQIFAHNGLEECAQVIEIATPSCTCIAIANAGEDKILDCNNISAILGSDESSLGEEYNYIWTDSNNNIVAETQFIEVELVGVYQLEVINSNLNCSVFDSVMVEKRVEPFVEIIGDKLACENEIILLKTNTNTNQILWSNNSNIDSLNVSQSGTYTATVTDEYGCTASSQIEIQFVDLPIVTNAETTCEDGLNSYAVMIQSNADRIEAENGISAIEVSEGNFELSNIAVNQNLTLTLFNEEYGCTAIYEIIAPDCNCKAIADAGDDQKLFCNQAEVRIGSTVLDNEFFAVEWLNSQGELIAEDWNIFVETPDNYTLIVTDLNLNCSATDIVEVISIQDPKPEIIGINEMCPNDTLMLSLDLEFGEVLWNTSENSNEIEVTSPGIYTVTVTDENGCTGESAFEVIKHENPTIILKEKICSNDLSTYVIAIQTDGDILSTDSFNAIIEDTNDGFKISNIDTSENILITVLNSVTGCMSEMSIESPDCSCKAVADAGPDKEITCSISTVALVGSNAISTGEFNYQWIDANGVVISNEREVYVSNVGDYELVITDLILNCEDRDTVSVLDKVFVPNAEIHSENENIINCYIGEINLYVIAEPEVTYYWSYGEENLSSTSIVIDHQTEVILTAIHNYSNCETKDTFMVLDKIAYPMIQIQPTDILDCRVEEVLIDASPSNTGGSIAHQWYTGNNEIIIGATALELMVYESGMFYLQSMDMETGCATMDSTEVLDNFIIPQVDAGFTAELPCDGTSISLNATASVSDGNYLSWTTDTGHILYGEHTTTPTIDIPGMYYLSVIDPSSGCENMDSVLVTENLNVPFDIDADMIDPICIDENTGSIDVSHVYGGGESFTYTLNGLLVNETGYFNQLSSGEYNLVIENELGCKLDTIIEINAGFEAELFADPQELEITYGDSAQINLVTNIVEQNISDLFWDRNYGVSCDDCMKPVLGPAHDMEYLITIFDEYGCSDTTTVRVTVNKEKAVYAPNIFTPNSQDENNIWYLFAHENVERIEELYIYNRWGELIFSQLDIPPNDASFGWDGMFRGKPAASDVYTFISIFRTVWGEKGEVKGDITVAY